MARNVSRNDKLPFKMALDCCLLRTLNSWSCEIALMSCAVASFNSWCVLSTVNLSRREPRVTIYLNEESYYDMIDGGKMFVRFQNTSEFLFIDHAIKDEETRKHVES